MSRRDSRNDIPPDDRGNFERVTLPDYLEGPLIESDISSTHREAVLGETRINTEALEGLDILRALKPDSMLRVALGMSGYLTTIPQELVVPSRKAATIEIAHNMMLADQGAAILNSDLPTAPALNSLLDEIYRENLVNVIFGQDVDREERVKAGLQLQLLMRYAIAHPNNLEINSAVDSNLSRYTR